MICNSFLYQIPSRYLWDLNWVRIKYDSLGWPNMGHLVYIQQICYQGGHIEDILEHSMLKFDWTFSNSQDLRVIYHVNSWSTRGIQIREWFFGCNHVVGGYKINEKILWLRESFLKFMESLMIFSLISGIRLPCIFRKSNVVLFKESKHLVYAFLHT